MAAHLQGKATSMGRASVGQREVLAWGGERGGSGPPTQEHATLLLLHCLGRGQHQRQQVGASGRFLKTGLAIPVHFCSCYL